MSILKRSRWWPEKKGDINKKREKNEERIRRREKGAVSRNIARKRYRPLENGDKARKYLNKKQLGSKE